MLNVGLHVNHTGKSPVGYAAGGRPEAPPLSPGGPRSLGEAQRPGSGAAQQQPSSAGAAPASGGACLPVSGHPLNFSGSLWGQQA